VKLYPELSVAALRLRLDKEVCLWAELRSLDTEGNAYLDKLAAIDVLVRRGSYTARTLWRILALGEGAFWLTVRTRDGQPRLLLRSLLHVAEHLGVRHFSRIPESVPLEAFVGRAKRRAWLFSTFFKPEGAKSNPISREAVAVATGISKRQQRRYSRKAGIHKHPNFAVCSLNGHLANIPMTVEGKAHEVAKSSRRLGNTYHAPEGAIQARRGILKRLNGLLSSGLCREVRPNLQKRFFTSVRSFVRAKQRHPEPFIRVSPGRRLIPGRSEWLLLMEVA
jgi:hypothetical protein